MGNSLHVDESGSIPKPKTQSPQAIRASAEARNSLTQIIIGGIILGLLSLAYIVALFKWISGASEILVIVGSGIGFLLGSNSRDSTGK
jgi:hypothetical protein